MRSLKFPLALFLLSLVPTLYATTLDVRDTIQTNTVWSADSVTVSSEVTIPNGVTLTIAPGTRVLFQGNYRLVVCGRLLAMGTVLDSIVFTPADTAAGWHGIRFFFPGPANDSSLLDYCRLEQGKAVAVLYDEMNSGGDGGALAVFTFHKLRVSHCTITRNTALYGGGGIALHQSSPNLTGNAIFGNTAGGGGGGIALNLNASATVIGNLIVRNGCGYQGGGIYIRQSYPKIVNNTVAYNRASYQGPGLYFYYASPAVTNTIIWGNNSFYNTFDSRPTFLSCNYADPLFADTLTDNFTLSPTSPSINAGADTNRLGLPATDLAGNPRLCAGRVDQGAYEDQAGSARELPPASDAPGPPGLSLSPNPFHPGSVITFRLPQAGYATLRVYDLTGREVAVPVKGFGTQGVNQVRFEPRTLPAGIYICKLESGSQAKTIRMILMR
jgi:parallel beta-helix repeat protein